VVVAKRKSKQLRQGLIEKRGGVIPSPFTFQSLNLPTQYETSAMAFDYLACPSCGEKVRAYRNPVLAVDIIIELSDGIVLIERKNEPFGWALPGGFVDYGETLEHAAIREAREETSLNIVNLRLLGCYSDPARDARFHTVSAVYVASAAGTPLAADDAAKVAVCHLDALPTNLCFDHDKIIEDYLYSRNQK
jgi:8-oxo-dGTP diphosphatase